MRELLTSSSVPDTQIWVEERSHSTYENALYGGRILRAHGIGRIALVVEARSMVRAAACFRKQGFEVVAAPSDFREWDPIGDEVLRTFAITMFANIRNTDRFGRYGGEEFLLLLPDTPADSAADILDRLREIIADLDWSAFSADMRVTISAGVATLRPDETSDTLLARADSALYAAKAKGRNRITTA